MALDLLGTHAFLPSLLAQLTNASPHPLPLDPVVLQSILLVFAAGQRRHLILKAVDPEEVGIIARIAEWTLSTVLNLPTHRLKVRPSKSKSTDNGAINPAAFVRSLFLSPSSSSSYNERTPSSSSMSQTIRGSGGHSRKHNYRHGPGSRGYSDPFSDNQTPPDPMVSHSPLVHPKQLDSSLASLHHHTRHSRSLSSQHSKSKSRSRMPPTATTATPTQIPTALVISGLEHASDMSQRALVRVLADGRVVLPKNMGVYEGQTDQTSDGEEETWELPESFVMVYVTSWDPRERPKIHKSLLDKFAMSTNITVQSKTKHALRSISIGPAANPFSNSPHLYSSSIPSTPLSALGSLPLPQTPPQQSVPLPRNMSNASASSAVNPFSPEHHCMYSDLTHRASRPCSVSPFFTSVGLPSSTSGPADPLLHPIPRRSSETATPTVTLNVESPSALPLSATFLSDLRHATARRTHISPSLNLYLQDLFTAARFDSSELDGTLLTARATEDAEMLARACRVLGTELGGWELIRGRESGLKSEQQEREACGGGDGSSGSACRWEFETGYDPSGSVVIDIGIEDVNGESDKPVNLQKPAVGKPKKEEAQTERSAGPSKVVFDEADRFEGFIQSRKRPVSGVAMFDVSEADVARIVPRVVSHRVRMRDGWTDQVLSSAVCGAAFSVEMGGEDTRKLKSRDRREGRGGTKSGQEDMTVKNVLVRILQKV